MTGKKEGTEGIEVKDDEDARGGPAEILLVIIQDEETSAAKGQSKYRL